MPEVKRSALLKIETGIELPISPPVIIVGRGADGKVVCKLEISAAGIWIAGPKGKQLANLNWEGLVALLSK